MASVSLDTSMNECSLVMDLWENYDKIIGDHRLVNRSEPSACCGMDGVTCENNGAVVGIAWNNKDLQGFLPDYIGKIRSLKSLDLSGNFLKGNIPSSIGNLTNLAFLNIKNNQFNGNVPLSFGKLSSLKTLLLSGNSLTGDLSCSLLNTTLSSIAVEYNRGLFGKVWLTGINPPDSVSWGEYAPGTRVAICNEGGSVAFCQSKPKCVNPIMDTSAIPVSSTGAYSSPSSDPAYSRSSSIALNSHGIIIAMAASIGLVALIGLFAYMKWNSGPSSFKQFDPEIKSDKKDKVHRLSLFLSKKTKNPSQMESIT